MNLIVYICTDEFGLDSGFSFSDQMPPPVGEIVDRELIM